VVMATAVTATAAMAINHRLNDLIMFHLQNGID
jgi:hypothetical protein